MEDAIRTGPGRISSHCDVICTGAPGRISSHCVIICTGASPGRISSHCDVICTGPGYGGITRANKFTLRRYLHGGITRANNPEMWTRHVLLFPGARGSASVWHRGSARPILSPALPPCLRREPTNARECNISWIWPGYTDSVSWTGTTHSNTVTHESTKNLNIEITNCAIRPWLPFWLVVTGE